MSALPPKEPRPGYPESPCIDICTLDDEDYCVGCRRSVQEIIDWSSMTADQQWAVVRALPCRAVHGS